MASSSTVSGNNAVGISGDGVALSLAMVSPFGVAVDSSGVIYVAELGSNRIRKIDTAGKITTAIGDGTQGFAGDGGAPNKVEMSLPTSVQVDSSGNLYFTDSLNNRIRKLSGGNVTTIAGNGLLSRSGDGGAATSAQLNSPLGVAVDAAGNLYVADTLNNLVRRVDTKGVITTFAGNGTAGFGGDGGAAASAQLNGPQGLAVDAAGNLYIADTQNARVRKVSGGTISTVAGSSSSGFGGDGGAAASAQLNAPFGVALDAAGNLYIAEFGNNRIRKVGTNGNISTIAGTGVSGYSGDGGAATSAQLNGPQSVVVDGSGNVYIADTGNNRVRKVGSTGVITTVAGNGIAGFSGDGGPAINAQVGNPSALAVDNVGNIYIADGSARVRKLFISRCDFDHRRRWQPRLLGRWRQRVCRAAQRTLGPRHQQHRRPIRRRYLEQRCPHAPGLGLRYFRQRRNQWRHQSERSDRSRRNRCHLWQRPRRGAHHVHAQYEWRGAHQRGRHQRLL